LRGGINLITAMLDRFEAAAPKILAGIQAAEELIQMANRQMKQLEDLLGAVLQEAAPFTEAVDLFVQTILDYMPFGIGERIRRAVQAMGEVLGFLPATVRLVNEHLLSPLRIWFPQESEDGVRTALFEPTRTQVLAPARSLLNGVVHLAEQWEEEFAQPVEEAVAQHQAIRQQISDYKRQHHLVLGKYLVEENMLAQNLK
jgi:hypothetical protein